uniref:DDAH family member 2, ADMA-independent n=1 Tax=Terrapene triunguis TaxID=2587831 RepID=A0A674JYB2_9SAUR
MASPSFFGRYTHAIVRSVPDSLGAQPAGDGAGPAEPVDLAKAHRQYGVYTGILRQKLGLQVIELVADEGLPRSVLVEDAAVIQGDTALVTRPWEPARRGEVTRMPGIKKVLEELKMRVVEVMDDGATLDGSDVLFTGREFFVGISKWTNHRGAEAVADAFRDFAVSTVPVAGSSHLKSFCSMAGPDTVAIGSSEAAKKAMRVTGPILGWLGPGVAWKWLLLTHNALLPRADPCVSPQPFQKLSDLTLIPAACSEVAKLGGALSSCSLLINKKLDR